MTDLKITDPILRRIIYTAGILSVIVLGFHTLGLFKNAISAFFSIFSPFLVSLVVAYFLAPVVIILQRKFKLGRLAGTIIIYFIFFSIIILIFVFLLPIVISEFIGLLQTLKAVVPDLLKWLGENRYFRIDATLIQTIQKKIDAIELDYEKIIGSALPTPEKLASGGFETAGQVARGIFSGIGTTVGFFAFLMFVGIINFYLLLDWDGVRSQIEKPIPRKHQERVFAILTKLDKAVGGFLRGQLMVALIVGSSFAVGLFFIGFIGFPALRNYCIFIGTVAAIGGVIPYLGPILGITPAVLIILLTGGVSWESKLVTLLSTIGLFSLIQTVEGFVLQPKIVGKEAGLHPLTVILALIVGAQFGLVGMMIAVPAAAVIRVLFREFYWKKLDA
jgi:predicted PurR-regulated permease PerM